MCAKAMIKHLCFTFTKLKNISPFEKELIRNDIFQHKPFKKKNLIIFK